MNKIRKMLRGEGGFTLIELLVTIAIMGVLFGIVSLALNGLSVNATTNTKAAELSEVQSAVDIYLAANYPNTTTIPARTSAATIGSSDTDAPFNTYLRSLPTSYSYSWTTDGDVTQP